MKSRDLLVAEVLSSRLGAARIGVVVDSVPDIDVENVLDALTRADDGPLYVSVAGFQCRVPKRKGIEFATTIESAVAWRNKPDCARSIIVFTQGDVAKSRSIEDFDRICTRDIAERLLETASEKCSANDRERAVWGALIKLKHSFPLQLFERYVADVERQKDRNDRMAKSLWHLGLVCDDQILSRSGDPLARLQRNREAIEHLGQLPEKSRKRMAQVISIAKGKERQRFQSAYETVMDYFRRGKDELLKSLTLDVIEQLIRAGKPLPQVKPGDAETDHDKPTQPAVQRPLRGRQLDKVIGEMVASGDRKDRQELKQLAGDLRDAYDEEGGNADGNITLGDQIVDADLRDETRAVLDAISHFCNEDAWGGCFRSEAEHIKPAFRLFSPKESRVYNPEIGDSEGEISLVELLKRFDNALGGKSSFGEVFHRICDTRKKIVGDAKLLARHPFVMLAPDKKLRENVSTYLRTFSELLAMFHRHEAELHQRHAAAVRLVARELLRLDVVHVAIKDEWKAVFTPLHPFFLWRYLEILNSIDSGDSEFSESDRAHLAEALAELPQVMHFLVSSPGLDDHSPLILPLAGSLFELPTYENHTNKYLGCDGLAYLESALELWLGHAPYSAREIRVAIINSPDLRETLREVLGFLSKHPDTTIILDAYWTQGNPSSPEARRLLLEQSDHELIDCLQDNRIVVSVIPLANVQEVEAHLQQRPAHILFTFDLGQFEVGPAVRGRYLAVSPLVITYKYEYDETLEKGSISPSSDSDDGIFSDFNFLVQRSADFPAGEVPQLKLRDQPNVRCLNNALKSGVAQWVICADRSLASYHISDGMLLNECRVGQREIGVWAVTSDHLLQNVHDTLTQYSLDPDAEKLAQIFKRFTHIAATGWKSLLQASDALPAANDKSRKAILGTVFAAAWYCKKYPGALIATLDSELASRWLVGKRVDQSRADLIGIRSGDNGEVVVEPIEVKSHASDADLRTEKIEGTRRRRLVGHAIDQIRTMVRVIQPIFGGEDHQPLFTPARREALKYQLHRECFRDQHSAEHQKRWYHLLQEVFARPHSGVPVRVKGKAIHVRFEELGELEDFVDDTENSLELVRLGTREIQELIGVSDGMDDGLEKPSRAVAKTPKPQVIPDRPTPSKHSEPLGRARQEEVPEVANKSNEQNHRGASSGKNRVSESTGIERSELADIEELAKGFRLGCQSFSIELAECSSANAAVGPNVTRLYIKLARGQRLDSLQKALEDVGREMARTGLVVTPIRDSDRLALDVPRKTRSAITIDDALAQLPIELKVEELPIPIGVTPEGDHIIRDLGKMPHLLVGGTTGAGKTIFLYGLLSALLTSHSNHRQLRLIISTSKREDFSHLDGLKHLEGKKVIDDAAMAIQLLQSKVREEFESRGNTLTESHCRDIVAYNIKHKEKMSPIVILIDEFADLADQLARDRGAKTAFYTNIRRVAQLGRSRGIHLVLCTQRPSAELVPSDIRSLLNSRVAFRVNKKEDSRMIIDDFGAEQLQLHGDMLFRDDKSLIRCLGYFTDVESLKAIIGRCK